MSSNNNPSLSLIRTKKNSSTSLRLRGLPFLPDTLPLVVREGTLGRSPKASQNALLWPKSSQIALLEGNLGRFRPSLPSVEGKLGRPSQIALCRGQSGTASRTK